MEEGKTADGRFKYTDEGGTVVEGPGLRTCSCWQCSSGKAREAVAPCQAAMNGAQVSTVGAGGRAWSEFTTWLPRCAGSEEPWVITISCDHTLDDLAKWGFAMIYQRMDENRTV